MRPLCALGVSAVTRALVLAALDVAGEPQLIVPGFEPEALVLCAAVDAFAEAVPFAFCGVFEALAFAAAVPAPLEPLDPPPPHAASTSDEDTNT
jgi:hypothetical protein